MFIHQINDFSIRLLDSNTYKLRPLKTFRALDFLPTAVILTTIDFWKSFRGVKALFR